MDDRDVKQSSPLNTDGGAFERLANELRRIADLMENRIAPALERLADSAAVGDSPSAGRASPLATIHRAIHAGELEEAGELIADLESEGFDDSALKAVRAVLSDARSARIVDLRARLAAARQVNDHETALNLEETLSHWLDPPSRVELRTDLLRWLMRLLMKRMRGGNVGADVAQLAERIAARFGETTEGASLRASLPTLRRSAGLCARCGGPYRGVDDACPRCLSPQPEGAMPPDEPISAPEAE